MTTFEILKILATICALAFAIIGHEIMHGYVAYLYGDNTAKYQGRLSINPIVHIDIVGTIIVPALLFISGASFMFGWAKPVPIYTPTIIRNGGYKAAIHVSLAGIAYNFTLAFLAFIFLSFMDTPTKASSYVYIFIYLFLNLTLIYNVVLGCFNLFPIPPLDGSRALSYTAMIFKWYPLVRLLESLERYGMIVLMLIIATPLSKYIFMPIGYVLNAIQLFL